MRKLLFLFLLVYSSLNAIEILYENKVSYLKNITNSLDKSNIKYTLKQENLLNQYNQIKNNKKKICAIAWYKDPMFEKVANYSRAIYKEKPYGIITQKRYNIEANTHIDRMIIERKYRVMVKENYPYDKELLSIINQLPKKKIKTNKDHNIITLIAKRRGDYMFSTYSNAKFFLEKHKYRSRIKFVPLNGMPEGKKTYLACSASVDKSFIDKFNKNYK